MATTLSPELAALVESKIASGRYTDTDALLREALGLLEAQERVTRLPAAAGPLVTVTKTYLAMTREQFRPTLLDAPDVVVSQSRETFPDFYRFLYGTVGRDYGWTDRLYWTDEQLREHLANPRITVLVLHVRGTPAGYAELTAGVEGGSSDLTLFGLFPTFHGRGLGKHFLSVAVTRAFDDGAARVTVDTNTLDGQYALANYRARGFVPYKTTEYQHQMSNTAERTPPRALSD